MSYMELQALKAVLEAKVINGEISPFEARRRYMNADARLHPVKPTREATQFSKLCYAFAAGGLGWFAICWLVARAVRGCV